MEVADDQLYNFLGSTVSHPLPLHQNSGDLIFVFRYFFFIRAMQKYEMTTMNSRHIETVVSTNSGVSQPVIGERKMAMANKVKFDVLEIISSENGIFT